MKNIFFKVLVCALCTVSLHAQNKPTDNPTQPEEQGRWSIYHSTWREWGHLPDCKGWGLCDYSDCWFCDTGDKYSGKVIVDKDTKKGYLVIELDITDPQSKDAVQNKSVFTVGADINNKNSILYKGQYAFDPTVGKYGGYKVPIAVK